MKNGRKLVAGIMSGLLTCTATLATSPGNPYQGIVDRNVFGLKPPPPPPAPPEAPKPPLPPITLTGITTILGNKRALLKATFPIKVGEAAKEQTFMLAEGQRDGDIEVLEIDEKAGSVKVSEFGTVTNLTFDKNGLKLANIQPPPTPSPGAPPNPAGYIPPPAPPAASSFTPNGGAVSTIGGSGTGLKTIPTRSLRLPTAGGAGSATPQGSIGAFNFGTTPPQAQTPSQSQPQYHLSPEQEALLIEVERERLRMKGDPTANLMPVTRLTPRGAPGTIPQEAPLGAGNVAVPKPQ